MATGLLSYFLQGKIVQRIISHDLHIVSPKTHRKDQILFTDFSADLAYRLQIYRKLSHIYNIQMQSAGKSIQHL